MMKSGIILSAFWITIGLCSCQKNVDIIVPDPNQINGPDTAWYASLTESMNVYALKQDIEDNYDYDTVTVSSGTGLNFTTASNLHFSINPGSIVTGAGISYTGNMVVKTMHLDNVGKSAIMMKPNISTSGRLLSSGGSLYVGLFNTNHQELFISANSNISVNYHSDNSNSGMKLFVESQLDPVYSKWQRPVDSTLNSVSVSGDNHTLHFNQTGWINCSTENFYNNQQSRISLRLPSNYTNANSIAFISFDDVNAVINFDYDYNGKLFKTGFVPAGVNAVVTVISKQGGNYFSKQTMISTLSTGASGGYQILNLTPVITSLASIKNSLRNL